MSLRIVANSHGAALRDAWEARRSNDIARWSDHGVEFDTFGGGAVERGPFHSLDGDVVRVDSILSDRTLEFRGEPGTTWGLCYGNHHRWVYDDMIFRTPHEPDLQTHHTSDALRRLIVSRNRGPALAFFDDLQRVEADFFVISAPPPRRGLRTPPEIVLGLYELAQDYLRSELDRRGIPFVETPAGMTDKDGFLRPEYCNVRTEGHPDLHHANVRYGVTMLGAVLRHHFGADGAEHGEGAWSSAAGLAQR